MSADEISDWLEPDVLAGLLFPGVCRTTPGISAKVYRCCIPLRTRNYINASISHDVPEQESQAESLLSIYGHNSFSS